MENSQTNIIAEIEINRDWRVKEFQKIKLIYSDLQGNPRHLQTYSSMCIPMIYAHWEGYCVATFRLVADHINNQRLPYKSLINTLFTYSQKSTYDYLKGKQSFEQRCKFSTKFIQILNGDSITIDKKLDAKSNLNFKIFKEFFQIFDIEIEHLKESYNRELDRLVRVRNSIVHGENSIVVDDEMIMKYINLVTELFDQVLLIFSDFLLNQKFIVEQA